MCLLPVHTKLNWQGQKTRNNMMLCIWKTCQQCVSSHESRNPTLYRTMCFHAWWHYVGQTAKKKGYVETSLHSKNQATIVVVTGKNLHAYYTISYNQTISINQSLILKLHFRTYQQELKVLYVKMMRWLPVWLIIHQMNLLRNNWWVISPVSSSSINRFCPVSLQ